MSVWLLQLALAASPEELLAAMPAARDQLSACARVGCEADAGAEAAWLVALHTYVSEGYADGELAATVRELDSSLYAELPEVVRQAASRPADWATRMTAEPPPWVSDGTEGDLSVEVVDEAGQPIRTAALLVRGRSMQVGHDGVFYGSLSPDGVNKGEVVELQLRAPGHHVQTLRYVMRKKNNDLRVVLKPFTPSFPADGAGAAAGEAWEAWLDRASTFVDSAAIDDGRLMLGAALRAGEAARAWSAEGGGDDAREICLLAGCAGS